MYVAESASVGSIIFRHYTFLASRWVKDYVFYSVTNGTSRYLRDQLQYSTPHHGVHNLILRDLSGVMIVTVTLLFTMLSKLAIPAIAAAERGRENVIYVTIHKR